MANQQISIKDSAAAAKLLLAKENGDGSISFYHAEDVAQRQSLLDALALLSKASDQATANTSLSAINTKLGGTLAVSGPLTAAQLTTAALATSAKQDTGNTSLSAIATSIAGTLTVTGPLTSAQLTSAALATSAKQDTANTSLASIASAMGGTLNVAGPLTNAQLTSAALATSAKQDTANTSLASLVTALTGALKNIGVDSSGAALQLSGVNVSGSLSAASDGTTNPTTGISSVARVRGDFNINVVASSDFAGTYVIERKFTVAGGTNWHPLTAIGTSVTFNSSMSEIFSEPAAGVDYRLRVTALTAGTVGYRICQ